MQTSIAEILEILNQQQAITGDDRYRASLWLKRRVALGQFCYLG